MVADKTGKHQLNYWKLPNILLVSIETEKVIFVSVILNLIFCINLTFVGEKAYKCQKCSVSRDEGEIEKMRSEIATLSDKASSFLSSGSILFHD